MRVIAGTFRGRKMSAPPGFTTRPTTDRVKEALFSILTSRIEFDAIRVLDVCAGSGSLGIEALSRGAGFCCFIEKDPAVKAVLQKNILSTCCLDRSNVLNMDAVKALAVVAGRCEHYDLVFLDPPYESGLYLNVLETLNKTGLLAPGAILAVECSVRKPLDEFYGNLKRIDRRVYGETALELFILEEK